MNIVYYKKTLISLAVSVVLGTVTVNAGVLVQCPGDTNDNAVSSDPDIKCAHLTAGDGFATMADGTSLYMFSYTDMTGSPTKTKPQKDDVFGDAALAHQWPAPTIELQEGQQFYLTLTNVGMMIRSDLFDPHTVHFHGLPQSSAVFDGLPDTAFSINQNASMTYYYNLRDPGTYMYHCHVEATEHMQMGMLGNLYVKPIQDGESYNGYTQFAYNDGDGSTGYDISYPIQLGSFDGAFHDASETVQPLPFALMEDNYPMINGRGYPDTVDPRTDGTASIYGTLDPFPPTEGSGAGPENSTVWTSQPVSSLIIANAGDAVLLRISNLAITRFYTLQSLGPPMRVVGKDARLLRGPDGKDLSYTTNSVTVGGGESFDVILEIPSSASGKTYFLYSANLNYLSNDTEEFGGMMTEIRIN